MPIYEYVCGSCGKTSEFLETLGSSAKHACLSCGGKRLRKAFSAFAPRTKSSARSGGNVSSGPSTCARCHAASCASCRR